MGAKRHTKEHSAISSGGSSKTFGGHAESTGSMPFLEDLQHAIGNRALGSVLGRSAPPLHPSGWQDRYEREADRIAERALAPRAEDTEPLSLSGTGTRPAAHPSWPIPPAHAGEDARRSFERRLGVDLSEVRIHADADAARTAERLGARAFTVGRDIALDPRTVALGSRDGRMLVAHELGHAIQQGAVAAAPAIVGAVSRIPSGTIQRQEREHPTSDLKVVVIGSPSLGEINAGHPYQFVHAAVSAGVDEHTVWIVERTGYELAGVDLTVIQRLAGSARLVWLSQNQSLIGILNRFPSRSIVSFKVFSHGKPANVMLRYGWEDRGRANYGISLEQARDMREDLFAATATIRFDSCNTGTSDWQAPAGNLAQTFADRAGRPVQAWTGRTSYAEVNRASGSRPAEVGPSRIMRGGPSTFDPTEFLSQDILDRTPRLATFEPAPGVRAGGFRSTFEIRVRLPESRRFSVPEHGAVVVTLSNTAFIDAATRDAVGSEAPGIGDPNVRVHLVREVDWGRDESIGTRSFPMGTDHREVWSNLSAGNYYLELWRGGNSNFAAAGAIAVDIRRHAATPGSSHGGAPAPR